jgi:hypothetical protein
MHSIFNKVGVGVSVHGVGVGVGVEFTTVYAASYVAPAIPVPLVEEYGVTCKT